MIAELHAVHPHVVPSARVAEVTLFLAVTFCLGWLLVLASDAPPVFALAFWVPGIAAIVLTRMERRPAVHELGLDRMGWADGYLLAYWLPVIFVVGACALAIACGAARLEPSVAGVLPADGGSPDGATVQALVQSLTIAPLMNMLVMVGPEIGWRAYLMPRLMSLGTWRAIAIVAALWALWQGVPLLGELAPVEWCVHMSWYGLVGVILGWLYVRTGSVWAPALFAGTVGATNALGAIFLIDAVPVLTGTISIVGLVIPAIAVIALRWMPLRDPTSA